MRYEVWEAETAQDALDRCRSVPSPDVILLDWHLPGLAATEFLATLRSTAAGRRPYVIYCTTENDPSDIARAFACGADDFLLKPFDRASLQQKFSNISASA
jgi:two-component system chemotaxis response regulator CheY